METKSDANNYSLVADLSQFIGKMTISDESLKLEVRNVTENLFRTKLRSTLERGMSAHCLRHPKLPKSLVRW